MNDSMNSHSEAVHHLPHWLIWGIRLALAFVIVLLGVMLYRHLLATAPTHERKSIGERQVVVEVEALHRLAQPVTVAATGTVVAARELSLMPQVSGRVVKVHPGLEPGGFIPAGTAAVELERTDYELALSRAEATLDQKKNTLADARINLEVARCNVETSRSALAQVEAALIEAQASYKLELGEQDVARRSWEMIEDRNAASELDRELALRQPYLHKAEAGVTSAKASVSAAEANLDIAKANVTAAETAVSTAEVGVRDAETAVAQARLDLERTTVTVPFDALVLERAVAVGTETTTQTTVAELVDRSAFWIEVSIPYDRLKWIRLPVEGKDGAAVTVRLSGSMTQDAAWQGKVIRCLPRIEENGRQVRLLVEVPEPMTQKEIPLLLNTFVTVEIVGPELGDVFVLSRSSIHNGSEIWLRNAESRMEIRQVNEIWANRDVVVIRDGITEGEELVLSDISSPVSGLRLVLPDAVSEPAGPPVADR